MTPDDPRHGTPRGYDAHRRDQENACQPCRRARARYEQERLLDRMRGTPRRVPAIGTARRIQGLVALGYSFTAIAAEAGVGHDMPTKWAKLTGDMTSRNARLVADVYDRLSMRLPDSRTRAQRSEATYARTMARRYGWAPPLAWDDIDNDPAPIGQRHHWSPDYDSRDLIDPATVLRILAGEVLPANAAERGEVVRRWKAAGESEAALCARMGWHEGRYGREDKSA